MIARWCLALLLLPALVWAGAEPLDREMRRLEQARDLPAMQARIEQATDAELATPEGHYWRVRLALLVGDDARADKLLEQGLDAHPQSSLLVLQHSSLLSEGFGEVGAIGRMRLAREVRAGLERAVELDPDSVQARLGLALYFINAPRIAGGGADRAEPHLSWIRDRAPMDYFDLQGTLAMSRGDMEAALDWLEQATRADPQTRPRFRRALILIALNRYDEARAVLGAIVERFPSHAAAWYQLGRTGVLAQDQLDQGLDALHRFLETPPWPTDPSPAAAWWRVGQLHQLNGDLEQARRAFEQALAKDRKFTRAAEALAALDDNNG